MDKYLPNEFPSRGFPLQFASSVPQFASSVPLSSLPPHRSYMQSVHPPCPALPQPLSNVQAGPPHGYVNHGFFPPSGLPSFNYPPPPSGFASFNNPPPNFSSMNRPPPLNSEISNSQSLPQNVCQNATPTPRYSERRFVPVTDFSPKFPPLLHPTQNFSPASDRPFNVGFLNSHLFAPHENYANGNVQSSSRPSEKISSHAAEIQSQHHNFASSKLSYPIVNHKTPMLKQEEISPVSSADADWAKKWIENRHLVARQKRQGLTNAVPGRQCVLLPQFRMLLAEYISLVNKLKSCRQQSEESRLSSTDITDSSHRVDDAENVSDLPESSQDKNCIKSDSLISVEDDASILARMKEIRSIIDDKDVLQSIQDRLTRANKKRMRLKRKRKERYEEEQERERKQERLEIEIAQWKNDVHVKEMDIKKEKEIKKAADEILSEVRRKLFEGRRSIKLLEHLRKLRAVRKDKALQRKNRIPKESDEIFEERVGAMTETMKQQIAMYEAEEQTLEVMLDMEQEENLVIERIARRKKERERLQLYETQLKTFLFGEDDIPRPSDPLFPYRQFYEVAQHSLAAFVRIRQDWDMFSVKDQSPGGSSVPLGWVIPVEPSNEIWASTLFSNDENT